jgi:iron complex transport system substrate-binding protein
MAERFALWRALACLLLAGPALAAAITVHDDRGQALRLTQPPARIVSLLPALTETVCALGQCQRLVAVDRYSNWPESVRRLPSMGGGLDFDLERVVAQRPDLVLMAVSARGAERLQALGIPVLALEPRSHADVRRVIDTLGQVLGLPQQMPRQIWQQIEANLVQAAQSLPPPLRGRSVYVEVSPTPHAASESSFIGQTLARLGLVNIVPGRLGPFPQVQAEFVVQAQPDVIMVGDSSRQDMLKRPGWSRLKALQGGRVCAFEPQESEVLMRPGPRLAEAAQLMVRCLQRTGA